MDPTFHTTLSDDVRKGIYLFKTALKFQMVWTWEQWYRYFDQLYYIMSWDLLDGMLKSNWIIPY